MAKVKRHSLKADQVRKRVQFHRRWRSILERDNQSINVACRQNNKIDQEKLNHQRDENETMASNECLRRWALKYNISKRAISELLTILISLGMNWLPKDSRTLLSTPRHVEMTNLTNGKLWYGFKYEHLYMSQVYKKFFYNINCFRRYNGIEKNIRMIFANVNSNLKLNLCINMDGLPLFNSSRSQFWPILASFFGNNHKANLT